jgi:hypothetical protein
MPSGEGWVSPLAAGSLAFRWLWLVPVGCWLRDRLLFARNWLWHTALENDDARYEREHTGSYQDPLQPDLQDRFVN